MPDSLDITNATFSSNVSEPDVIIIDLPYSCPVIGPSSILPLSTELIEYIPNGNAFICVDGNVRNVVNLLFNVT